MYLKRGCLEITLEVSDEKIPNSSQLYKFWEDNKRALLAYMSKVHSGVSGRVTDSEGRPISAQITIEGNDKRVVSTDSNGTFFLMVWKGSRTVRFESDGFYPKDISVQVDGLVEANVSLETRIDPENVRKMRIFGAVLSLLFCVGIAAVLVVLIRKGRRIPVVLPFQN